MRKRSKVIYSGYGWDLTVRELLFSIAIVLVMLTVGFFLSEKIASANDEANQEYYQAMKINADAELFQYGMRTNVGNAFVSGTLEAVGPVSYPDIDGEYAYAEKIKEKYTEHTKVVDDYDEDGNKVGSHIETYWEWDEVDRESIHCESIKFLGVEFPYGTIGFPGSYYIDTVNGGYHIRYKYYGCDTSYDGTIYAKLASGTINGAKFINGRNTDEAVDYMVGSGTASLVLFWFVWIVLSGGAVYGFCYLDNRWLEDE